MDSTLGWSRAKIKLKGIDVNYRSIKEFYYMSALKKERDIEMKKNIALITSNVATKSEDVQKALNEYLKELIPSLKEGASDFVEDGSKILDKYAGQEIILGGDENSKHR